MRKVIEKINRFREIKIEKNKKFWKKFRYKYNLLKTHYELVKKRLRITNKMVKEYKKQKTTE